MSVEKEKPMEKERFKLVPAVYLLLQRDGKVLMIRRKKTGWQDGQYTLVSGHLDGGEQATQAAIREAREEAGIEINPEDLIIAHVMHKNLGEERIDLYFSTSKWKGEPINNEPEKCDDMAWFPTDKLPENTIPQVKQAISLSAKGVMYSESGWKR